MGSGGMARYCSERRGRVAVRVDIVRVYRPLEQARWLCSILLLFLFLLWGVSVVAGSSGLGTGNSGPDDMIQ